MKYNYYTFGRIGYATAAVLFVVSAIVLSFMGGATAHVGAAADLILAFIVTMEIRRLEKDQRVDAAFEQFANCPTQENAENLKHQVCSH
jgi:hypothetical protein